MRGATPVTKRAISRPYDFDSLLTKLEDPEAMGAAKYLPPLRSASSWLEGALALRRKWALRHLRY